MKNLSSVPAELRQVTQKALGFLFYFNNSVRDLLPFNNNTAREDLLSIHEHMSAGPCVTGNAPE